MNALILVDLQNDFLPGGALAVPDGDKVIPVANRLLNRFELAFATQDWHPPDHGSFASRHPTHKVGDVIELHGVDQVLWPDHCVQSTPGSEFAADLNTDDTIHVFRKGVDPKTDSYSGFFDNDHQTATGLNAALRKTGVEHVFILGLATDYCVKFTALDARQLGFTVTLIEDGCRGVNLQPGDIEKAMDEMATAGITISQSDSIK